MRFSYISIIIVVLVVIAVALAGCSDNSQKTPSGGKIVSKATVSSRSTSSGSSGGTRSSGSSGGSGSSVNGADLFGTLSYNWVEYKMSVNSGGGEMTVYMKWNKQTGKCSMRFEGAGAQQMQNAGMSEMDCSNSGQTQSNPNQISSDAQVSCSPLPESVTVPAGTFSATKCTVTSKGNTASVWVVKNKFMVKMESNPAGTGPMTMVLNAYG